MEEAALVAAHSPKVKQTFTKILILYIFLRFIGALERLLESSPA